MASESEASCDADPNFAVICSFLEKFGQACGLHTVDILDLQEMLENTQEVSPILIDLHVKLLRKMRRSVTSDRWERSVVKICHSYSNQDAWEIERFGYKKSRLSVKLRLLKELLEMQFDGNPSFKNKINVITAKELRSQPLGRDKLGNAYWYQADDNCQIRVYKEDLDEETWALVAKDREGLVTLISKLSDNQDSSSTDAATNEDSNSVENKPVIDTGQQDSNSSNGKKTQSDEDKAESLLKEALDDEDTKMEGKAGGKCDAQVILVEEKKPELSGIKEKYIRSDNFVQSNRKAVESAGFVDVDVGHVELKRPSLEDIDELSLLKRPRTDRPSLLGDKKKPYLRDAHEEFDEDFDDAEEEEEDVEEEEQLDEEEEDDDDDEADDENDNESPVSDEIHEPLMLVMGKGNGEENHCGNLIVGEEIAEEVLYFFGEGSGRESETGNGDDGKQQETQGGQTQQEVVHKAKTKDGDGSEGSSTSQTKNNFKLGMIIDSKIDHSARDSGKVQPKRSPSRWDVGKPDYPCNSSVSRKGSSEMGAQDSRRAVCDSGAVRLHAVSEETKPNDDGPVVKKPSFFFGPSSGFAFKTPSPVVKPPAVNFGFASTALQKAKIAMSLVCNPVSKDTIENQTVTFSINSGFSNTQTPEIPKIDNQIENPEMPEDSKPDSAIKQIVATAPCEQSMPTCTETQLLEDDKELLSSSVTDENCRGKSQHMPLAILNTKATSTSLTSEAVSQESAETQNKGAEELIVTTVTTGNLLNNQNITDAEIVVQKEPVATTKEVNLKQLEALDNNESTQTPQHKDKSCTVKEQGEEAVKVSPKIQESKSKVSESMRAFSVENLLKERTEKKEPVPVLQVIEIKESKNNENVEIFTSGSIDVKESASIPSKVEENLIENTLLLDSVAEKQSHDHTEKAEDLTLTSGPSENASIQKELPETNDYKQPKEIAPEGLVHEESTAVEIIDEIHKDISENMEGKLREGDLPEAAPGTSSDISSVLASDQCADTGSSAEALKANSSKIQTDVPFLETVKIDENTSSSEALTTSKVEEMKQAEVSNASEEVYESKLSCNEEKYEKHDVYNTSRENSLRNVAEEKLSDIMTTEEVNEAPISSNKIQASEVPTDSSVQDKNEVSLPSANQAPDSRLDIEADDVEPGRIDLEPSETTKEIKEELSEHLAGNHASQPDTTPMAESVIIPPILSPETPQHQVLKDKAMPELLPSIVSPIEESEVPPHDYKVPKPELPLASLLESTGRMSETMHMFSAHTALMGETEQPHLLEVGPLIKESSYISQMTQPLAPEESYISTAPSEMGSTHLTDLSKMPPVLRPEGPITDSLVIQEIGTLTTLQPLKSSLSECDPEIEKQIVSYEVAADASHAFPLAVPINVPPPVPQPFNEIPCEQKTVGLLTENVEQSSDGDMNFDDDNVSEPMDLEESKSSHIIEHTHGDIRPSEVLPMKSEIREEKKPSLQSLSLDFTGEAPDLSEVQALVNRSKKREVEDHAKLKEEEQIEEATGGKRRKIRGKRSVDKNLRKSIEDAKNKHDSSSDDDDDRSKPKIAHDEPKPEKKTKARRKKLMMGLEIPDDGVLLDQPTGLRQSRRIAQLKIKEEAERRKLEEIALEEMKNSQKKKKNKKDDDKDYKAEKRKRTKILSEDDTTNDGEVDGKMMKKKKKRKHRKFDEHNPWRTSSEDSSTDVSHVEEEEEEEEHYVEIIKSDHEFSPESDLENAQDVEPLKRARTVKKEDQEEEEDIDDTNCQKCNKSDHPEWILLCDGCDAGWHCSCLRPALLVIPEGDWYCPPCQHTSLIKHLQEKLVEFDKVQTKREMEIRRKERLAYVGISLDNVLPAKDEDSQKTKRQKVRRTIPAEVSADDSGSGSESQKSDSDSESESESGSSSSSPDSDEPIYKLRQRRQAQSYRFKDYDELIKSAVQEEVDEMQQTHDYQSKGKDMSTIVQAEGIVDEPVAPQPQHEESDDEIIRPAKKIIGKKKHRKLNSLDISSEEDEDSDEDFKGSSGDEDEDEEYDEYNEYGSSSSSSSLIGRRRKGKGVRRSTRARTSRYDAEFINDETEDSDEPRRKRNRSDWEDSDESDEESDNSWKNKKKRTKKRLHTTSITDKKKKKTKKNKNRDDSDPEVYRRKKPKNKFGAFDDNDIGRRRTRGKKINYLDALGTDSEEESRRRNQVKEEESEDEFVLNEEEDDVQYQEGREADDSDDSTTGRLVPGVKKGSKKGKGKGGIKRIKRAQGEEEEALFPPLTSAPTEETLAENEPNPIEQINKNLEAMDEKEIGMMMEEEEYANKQLQMVAAQLEKEKRRKEMEARKLEMQQQTQPPEVLQSSGVPSVIQALPVTMPQIMSQMAPQMRSLHPEQLQPIHHDIPQHSIHQNLPSMYHQSPQHMHQSPQHMIHMPPVNQSAMMMADAATPKKRGRKPKTQLGMPEMQFMPSTPSDQLLGDESDIAYNTDGTSKRRRGRGKGKKTLEKEAAAAAGVSGPAPTSSPPIRAADSKEVPERKASTPEIAPMAGGKLGVAAAPQPFSQNQPKPSVITRMLQTQPGQPAYPVGSHTFPERQSGPPGLIAAGSQPFMGGPNTILTGVPPRVLHPGTFRPGLNHYPVIRSGAPPIRPQNVAPHLYHHPLDTSPGGVSSVTPAERSSPAHSSPSSVSPLSNKSDQTPPPPQYAVRPPMVRFPPTSAVPGMPRHPQLLSQLHPSRLAYPGAPPQHTNYHYAPSYSEGGGAPPNPPSGNASFLAPPTQYQEQFAGGDAEGAKNYDEENGEFGGLVSYFSSQREDDLDT